MTALAVNPTLQLAARCRDEPIIIDEVLVDLCPQLADVILRHAKTDRSTQSLNVGGWKSTEDFLSWPDAPVQQLRQRIVAELGSPRPIGWAMVNRAGSQHPRHQHRAAFLTGLFYVAFGSEDSITPTVFEYAEGELEIEPQPGRLVIFRGEVWHRVPVYPGELPRITVAFDVRR